MSVDPEVISTDCRTEEGEAVMMVDALIIVMRQVAKCDFANQAFREALRDLYSDKATTRVMGPLLDATARGELAAGRNRLNRGRQDGRMWFPGPLRFRQHPDLPDLGTECRPVARAP